MTGLPDSPDSVSRETDPRDFHREQLSAMMDGALSADETKFLLRRMEHDDALADCWERWQFVGDALRGQADRALPADFSRRVGRAIADDLALATIDEAPLAVAAHGNARGSLLRWGSGAALAASVALAALIGTRVLSVPDGKTSEVSSTASASVPTPAPMTPAPATPIPAIVGVAQPPAQAASLIAEAGAAVALAAVAASDRRSSRPRILAREQAVAVSPATTKAIAATAAHTTVVASAAVQGRGVAPQPEVISKPWPRALVPGASANGELNADFEESPAFHPFQPRFDPQAPQLAHPMEGTSSPP
jgi:negative regulator of sigma E activity